MKEHNFILTILAVLIFGVVANAQEGMTEGRNLPKDFPADLLRKMPEGCPAGAKRQIISRDKSNKITLSSAFSQYANQTSSNPQFPRRGYGEAGPDRIFYDSFPVGGCRICAATLIAQVANEGGHNDALHVWLSPSVLPLPSPTLASLGSYATGGTIPIGLWISPTETTKTVSVNLDKNKINQYIISSIQTPMLDVMVQDDTRVDSMQLVVWRY
jgi:hypothetical protein